MCILIFILLPAVMTEKGICTFEINRQLENQ